MALADLRQLLRIAEQHQVLGCPRHRDGVGQAELTGLLDDEQVEAGGVHPAVVGEIPCGAADYASLVRRNERGVLVLADVAPSSVGGGVLLGDPIGIDLRLDQVAEEVLHHRV